MTKFLAKSFSVSYNTSNTGYVVLHKEQDQWRIIKTLFDYQVKEFKECHSCDIEKGLLRIERQ